MHAPSGSHLERREDSLLGIEVRAFRCACCAVERWGGHVALRVSEPLAFCFPCAKRLRLPAWVTNEDVHGGPGGD